MVRERRHAVPPAQLLGSGRVDIRDAGQREARAVGLERAQLLGVQAAHVAGADQPESQQRHPSSAVREGATPSSTMPARSASRASARAPSTMHAPASKASTRARAFIRTSSVPGPITGTSNREVLGRLGYFEHAGTLAAELARPQYGGVGSLDRLDGEHGPILHDDTLADVLTGDRLRDGPAEREVLELPLARPERPETPLPEPRDAERSSPAGAARSPRSTAAPRARAGWSRRCGPSVRGAAPARERRGAAVHLHRTDGSS